MNELLISFSFFIVADLISGVENGHDNMDSSRRQKKSENISEYNKLAMQGGHKGKICLLLYFHFCWSFEFAL